MDGTQFRVRRRKLKMTQETIAEKIGVSANTVARWERDELPISRTVELALKAIEAGLDQTKTPKTCD